MTKSVFLSLALPLPILLLSACGGGGSSTEPTTPRQPPTGGPQQPPTGGPQQPPTGGPQQPPTGGPQPPKKTPQQKAAETAASELTRAENRLSSTNPTSGQINAVKAAIAELETAIGKLSSSEDKKPHQDQLARVKKSLRTAEELKKAKDAKAQVDEELQDAKDAANAAEAKAKELAAVPIYGFIAAAEDRDNLSNDAYSASDNTITVLSDKVLSASSDSIANLNRWTGRRYTLSDDSETYEAHMYSDIGEGTEGKKFATEGEDSDYEYELDSDGYLISSDFGLTDNRLIKVSTFRRTSGTQTFTKDKTRHTPDPNDADDATEKYYTAKGSYHGVDGDYECTGTAACTITVAASGLTLAGEWKFKPGEPENPVTDTPDGIYLSYGYWIKKDSTNNIEALDVFRIETGAVEAASGVTALNGTATYIGGAVGMYAIKKSPGVDADSGSFTATATLTANFDTEMIGGTINNFSGPTSGSPWSIELEKVDLGGGTITGGTTVWTIDGIKGDSGGKWEGVLYENDSSDGVPSRGTGTFYSEYSNYGRIIGAFGVNKQ